MVTLFLSYPYDSTVLKGWFLYYFQLTSWTNCKNIKQYCKMPLLYLFFTLKLRKIITKGKMCSYYGKTKFFRFWDSEKYVHLLLKFFLFIYLYIHSNLKRKLFDVSKLKWTVSHEYPFSGSLCQKCGFWNDVCLSYCLASLICALLVLYRPNK